jgi:hypothetical protein
MNLDTNFYLLRNYGIRYQTLLATVQQTSRDRHLSRDLRLGATIISFDGLHVLANIMLPIWVYILRLK